MQRILLLVVVVTLWISPIGAQENKEIFSDWLR